MGSMMSYVAVPYQIYQLTKDNWYVGVLGIVQLVPILIFGIVGGAIADRINRKKLILVSEILMAVVTMLLGVNAFMPEPSVIVIFILVALLQAVLGFHRPAMEAMTQKMVMTEDYPSIGALGSFRYSVGAITGPAIGGIIISMFGVKVTYLIDLATFIVAILFLIQIRRSPDPEKSESSTLQSALEGLRFALSKPELVGTYVIDIVAMVFAFPVALYPAMSEKFGGAQAAGYLFSAMALGALIMTIFSGWTNQVKWQGRAVILAALFWGVFIIAVGFSESFWLTILFLAMAGAADMVSGLFRQTIWNQSIPNSIRGRMSGIEMVSYMSGPLIGNARAGWMASKYSVSISLWSGGIICVFTILVTVLLLPHFWNYYSSRSSS